MVEAFRSYKRREAAQLVRLYETKSAAAMARANALQEEMAAGTALWLGGAAPPSALAALRDEADEAPRLAADETERGAQSVRHMMDLQTAIDRVRAIVGATATAVRLTVFQDESTGAVEPVLAASDPRGAGGDEDAATTPKWERERRQKARAARFCVALEVNGRVVPGTSQPRNLSANGSFALDVAHAFVLSVTKWPRSARLLVFEKGVVLDTFVAAVPVAVPGAAAGEPLADAAPRQYQFSAEEPFTPLWERDGMHLIAQVRVGGEPAASDRATVATGAARLFAGGSLCAVRVGARGGPRVRARRARACRRGSAERTRRARAAAAAQLGGPARAAAAARLGTRTRPAGSGGLRRHPTPQTPRSVARASPRSARRWTP